MALTMLWKLPGVKYCLYNLLLKGDSEPQGAYMKSHTVILWDVVENNCSEIGQDNHFDKS